MKKLFLLFALLLLPTTAWAQADTDGDGVEDSVDSCPTEDASFFDADGDGCLDELRNARHVEYWDPDDLPLEYFVHEDGAPLIDDGSDLTALAAGFTAWNAPGIQLTASFEGTIADEATNGFDGVHTISFVDPSYLEIHGSSVIAVGLTTSFDVPTNFLGRDVRPGQIVDADMLFNPGRTYSTPTQGAGTDLRSVATHEAGHLFGLSHGAIPGTSLYPALPSGNGGRSLEADDLLVAFMSAPEAGPLATANRISGRLINGLGLTPLPGALILATSATGAGQIASTFTLPDGSWQFVGLPADDYYITAQPLDGSEAANGIIPGYINSLVSSTAVTLFLSDSWDDAESTDEDRTARTAIGLEAGNVVENIDIVTNVDAVAPSVTEIRPGDLGNDVRSDTLILVRFSEGIHFDSARTRFRLERSSDSVGIAGSLSLISSDQVLIFDPRDRLGDATQYRLVLSAGIEDLFGNPLPLDVVTTFTTEPAPPLELFSASPLLVVGGTELVLAGQGFDTSVTANNLVFFGGIAATPSYASATHLVVQVPADLAVGTDVDVIVRRTGQPDSNPITLSVISRQEIARGTPDGAAVLAGQPQRLDLLPDANFAYVAHATGLASVVINPGQGDYRGATEIALGAGTEDVAVHPDTRRVYATSAAEQILFVINSDYGDLNARDPQFNSVLDELAVGATPRALTIDPDGTRAFLVVESGLVQVWDVQLGSATFHEQIGEIQTPAADLSAAIGFDRTGSRLLVAAADGRLFVYNADDLNFVAEIPTAADPRDIAADPAASLAYVTHGGSEVSVVSLGSNSVLRTTALGGSAAGIGVSPAGLLAYVANATSSTLDVIDLDASSPTFRQLGSQFEIGGDPVDVSVAPDGQRVFALEANSNELRILGIGFGPVILGITPTQAKPGDIVTIWGEGFGNVSLQPGFETGSNSRVLFGDIAVQPEHSMATTLWATVPAGWNGESVRVSYQDDFTVLNEVLSNPIGLRMLEEIELPVATRASLFTKALTLDGDVGTPEIASGLSEVSADGSIFVTVTNFSVNIHDAVASSPTFMTVLAAFDASTEANHVPEEILIVPGSNMILVGYIGSVVTVIDGQRGSPTFGQKLANYDFSVLGYAPQTGTMACTPDGKRLVIAELSQLRVMSGGLDPAHGNYLAIDWFGGDDGRCTDIAMHPNGMVAYAMMGGDLYTLDLDEFSGGFLTTTFNPVLANANAVDVSPDGTKLWTMTNFGGLGDLLLDEHDLTFDPLQPSSLARYTIEANGGGETATIAISPQGRYGIISLAYYGAVLYDFETHNEITRFLFEGDTLLPYGMDWWPDGKLFLQSPWYSGSASVYGYKQGFKAQLISGFTQTGVAGQPLAAPLSILYHDGQQNPSPNTLVEAKLTGGGGTLGNGTPYQVFLTDAAGRIRFDWTMGPVPDPTATPTNTVDVRIRDNSVRLDWGIPSIGDPALVPISLASLLPSDASTGVAVMTSVQAVFSRPVNVDSITPGSFSLLGPGSVEVAGRFGFADGNRRVSFLPSVPLDFGSAYTLAVSAAILDESGNPLSNPASNGFTTQAPPDIRIAAISPPAAVAGTFVSISGVGFDTAADGNLVSFGGAITEATASSPTSMRVLVPFEALSGPVTVSTPTPQTSNELNFSVLIPTTAAIDEVLGIVETGATVRTVAITPDGKFAYSVSTDVDQVLPVELATLEAGSPIPVGKSPVAIAMHPAGTRAYVANQLGDDVSVIDLTTNFVVATIPVGDSPIDLVAAQAGDRIYVVNSASQTVSVIDVDAGNQASFHTVVGVIPTGATSKGAALSPDGTKLYLGTSNGFLIVSLDPNEYGVVGVIPTGATTKGAAISPDGSLLILLTTTGDVLVVDITPEGGNAVVGVIPTGATTKGAAISPDGTLLYIIPEVGDEILVVELINTGSVSKADSALGSFSFNILGTIFVGEDPQFLVFDPTGSGRAVAIAGGGTGLTILSDEPLCLEADLFLEPRSETEPHRGRWILGYVEFPLGYDGKDIDLSSVRLQSVIPCVPERIYFDDIDNDGIDEIVFSFERLLFQDVVAQGEAVEVTVTGNFAADGRPFCSSDIIRTQRPELQTPSCGDVWSPGDKVTITWQSPAGVDTDFVDLLYSVDDGEHWFPMLLGEFDDGEAVWTVPAIGTTVLRIAIIGYDKDKDDYGMTLLDCRGQVSEGVIPVAMSEVRLKVEDGASVLRWDALGAAANAGFFVSRAEAASGPYTRLNASPLLGVAKDVGLSFEFADEDIDANRRYWYRLDEVAAGFQHGPYELHWTLASALSPNSPNPFNPRTKIHFAIGQSGRTRLAIYDLRGRLVRVLLDTNLRAREYDVIWDGADTQGSSVASGIYVYRLSAPGFEQSKKMTLVR